MDEVPRPPRFGSPRLLVLAGVAAPAVFTVGWLVAGAVQPGYSPRRDDVSVLAARSAEHPWLAMAVLCATGLALVAFGLAVAGDRSAWPLLLGPLVFAAGLAVVAGGTLRIDCSPDASAACRLRADAGLLSLEHRAHVWAVTIALGLIVAAALVAALDRRARRRARAGALVVALAALGLFFVFRVGLLPDWRGVLERATATVPLLWVATLAGSRLRRPVPAAEPADAAAPVTAR